MVNGGADSKSVYMKYTFKHRSQKNCSNPLFQADKHKGWTQAFIPLMHPQSWHSVIFVHTHTHRFEIELGIQTWDLTTISCNNKCTFYFSKYYVLPWSKSLSVLFKKRIWCLCLHAVAFKSSLICVQVDIVYRCNCYIDHSI